MGRGDVVMFEEEQQQIQAICDRLQRDSNSIAILVINKDGQEIARAGNTEHLDVTSLSSLFAGNVAATGGIRQVVIERQVQNQAGDGHRRRGCSQNGKLGEVAVGLANRIAYVDVIRTSIA